MKCYPIIAAACCLLALGACKKEKKTTSCTPAMYGYHGAPWLPSGGTPPAPFFGHIDPATMTSSALDSVAPASGSGTYSNQATFNTSDNCYYVFRSNVGFTVSKLLKITPGGTITEYTNAGGPQHTEALVYNPITNKLYCLLGGSSGPAAVAEVSMAGTSYTVTPVAWASGIAYWASPATSTVNGSMGEMYFSMLNSATGAYSIEQYHPGAGATTVIASGTGAGYLGLRYNSNDNMLYAIKQPISTFSGEFVKITPGGSISTLASLPFQVNNEFYSTTLDHCNNRYILSTLTGSPWSTTLVTQLNMSGAIVQSDTTAALYQGLDILY